MTNLCFSLPIISFFLSSLLIPINQVENIENPLSSYNRVEPDNGVHMRVIILWVFFLDFFSPKCVLFRFKHQSLACLRLCCRIRTTGRWDRPTSARSLSAASTRAVGSFTPRPTTSRWAQVLLKLEQYLLESIYNCCTWPFINLLTSAISSCRSTSARTLGTNRTSVSFLLAGRSLLQVLAHNILSEWNQTSLR